MPRSSTPNRQKISSSIRTTSIAPSLSPILSRHSTSPITDLTKSPEPYSRSVGVATTPRHIRHSSSTSSASPGVTQYTVRAIIHASRSPTSISRSPTSIARSTRGRVSPDIFDIMHDWSSDQTALNSESSIESVIPVHAKHRIQPILYSSDSSNSSSTSSEKGGVLSRLFDTLLESPQRNLILSPIQLLHSDRSDEIFSESNERSSEDNGNVSSVRFYPDTSSPSIFIDLTTSDDDDADVLDNDEEKERLKLLELEAKRKKSERRKVKFDKPDYLNIDGVEWHSYNHHYISFTFSSSRIYPNHFDPKLQYRFSLKFNGKRWIIKRFQVPNYEKILKLYKSSNMYDRHVNSFLKSVLKIIRSNIDEQVMFKNQKMRLYYLGHKTEINVSDEIMLSEFERRLLKRKRTEIEERMIPPKPRKFVP